MALEKQTTTTTTIVGLDNARPSGVHRIENEPATAQELSRTTGVQIGSLFAERYTILTQLGAGGMSVVFLARHESLGKRVAVKTLLTHLAAQNVSLLRFKNEAKAASMLNHPNIVSTFDYGITGDGTPYLVMDYLEGEPLSALIESEKSLKPAVAIDIFLQATAGLAHAHAQGIVHRDLKPSNLMLCGPENKREVKVVDFGVAKIVADSELSRLTQTGEAVGSPLYMSPEQCLGQSVDHRSDIYSLGVLMYEALTGVQPFVTESVFGTIMKQINDLPPSFKSVNPSLETQSGLEKIVFKALAKDPGKRHQSMAELRDDLQALRFGHVPHLFKRIGDQIELWLMKAGRSVRFVILLAALAFFVSIWGGAACGVMMLPRISAMPTIEQIKDEPAPWGQYPDRAVAMSRTHTSNSSNPLVGRLVDHLVAFQNEVHAGSKLGIDDMILYSKEQREQHNYEDSAATCKRIILDLNSVREEQKSGVENFEPVMRLWQTYQRLGEDEYYQGAFGKASEAFESQQRVVEHLRAISGALPMRPEEYLMPQLKLVDCYYFNGKYDRALRQAASFDVFSPWSQFEPSPRLVALFNSKMGELNLRAGHLDRAARRYDAALKAWKQTISDTDADTQRRSMQSLLANSSYEDRMDLLLCAGKYGEILQYHEPKKAAPYLQLVWDNLNTIHTNDEKLAIQLSNILQSYANNLWQEGKFWQAWQVHQKAEAIKPRL